MTDFPVALVHGGAVYGVFRFAEPFTGPDGVQHPAIAWAVWSSADWAAAVPGVTVLPLVDTNPATASQIGTRNATSAWTVGADAVTATYTLTSRPIADRRAAVVAAINAERDRRLNIGAPYAGKHIDVMSENALAVIGGVTSAAILANAGALEWGSPFNTHIAQDNSQISLATAADGIAFAGAVGDWYGGTVLRARTLKDEALSSNNPEAIDILAEVDGDTPGWPAL